MHAEETCRFATVNLSLMADWQPAL